MTRPQKPSFWRQKSAASLCSTVLRIGSSPLQRTLLVACALLLWILLLQQQSSSEWSRNAEGPTRHSTHPKMKTKRSVPNVDALPPLDNDKIHIVFSTGCNAFQDWQSYVFFFQLWKSGQTGHVTRIVSGCRNAQDEQTLRDIFDEQIRLGIPTGRDRFHMHVTPDYSHTVPKVHYKPLNKPFGVVHWMEHALGFPGNMSQYADTMFIVLDPDQILMRPFTTRDFDNDVMPLTWLPKAKHRVLEEGHPISQYYAFGGSWVNQVNKERQRVIDTAWSTIQDNPAFTDAMKTSSHLNDWTPKEVNERYAAGPPYIALGPDLYRISVLWAGLAVPVYELTKNHVSEMFMYSAAAAHLNVPHDLAYDFMFSNPEADGYEMWQTVDEMPPQDLCRYTTSDNDDPLNVQYRNRLPYLFHYCQEYYHGPYYFFKYFLPSDFLSCSHPLLLDPTDHDATGSPFVLALSYNTTQYKLYGGLSPTVTFPHRLRHTFSLCHLIARINEAAQYWKEQFCTPETANFNKLFIVRPS